MEIVFIWLVLAAVAGILGSKYGRGGLAWFVTAFIFSPLVILILLAQGPKLAAQKKCPQCAEKVLREALVCRFCRYEFTSIEKTHNTENRP